MIERWRTFARPETVEALEPPTAAEALALWLLGTLWTQMALWLALWGGLALVPLALASGLLTVWGWRRDSWLGAFPIAAVVALAADQAVGLARIPEGKVSLLDLLVIAAAFVSIARGVAFGRANDQGQATRRPRHLLPMTVAIAVVGAVVLAPRQGPWSLIHLAALVLALYWLTKAATLQAGGARATTAAFSLASAWSGAIAWTAATPAFAALASPSATGAEGAAAIACALPLAWARALERPHRRWLAAAAAIAGTLGLALAMVQRGPAEVPLRPTESELILLAGLAIVGGLRFVRLAVGWEGGSTSQRTALVVTFVLAGPLLAVDLAGSGVWVAALVALAGGLTRGVAREPHPGRLS
jgi:hypothetical protein